MEASRRTGLCLSMLLVACCTAQKLESFKIDPKMISVSGVSSGGAMAIQFHIAHSAEIMGMASIAGPPYYCANANIALALTSCKEEPMLISLAELWAATEYARATLTIDSTTNLQHSKVWLLTGLQDTIVVPGVVEKAQQYYQKYLDDSSIKLTKLPNAEHAWITDFYGNNCSYFGFPYINNCDFDAAGDLLQFIYGKLNPRVDAHPENIFSFDQGEYTPLSIPPANISLGNKGFYYVPESCQSGNQTCKLHIYFHGCLSDATDAGNTVYTHTGLNEWAESNNIVVMYPQTQKSQVIPYNPEACWDWWGYTGLDYAVKIAPQILSIQNMIDAITGNV